MKSETLLGILIHDRRPTAAVYRSIRCYDNRP